jgi:hypothetical protein
MLTVARNSGNESLAVSAAGRLYQRLSTVDFIHDVLEGQEASLRVVPVPKCGWTDVGTPQRVAQALLRLPAGVRTPKRISANSLRVNLASQHERREMTEGRSGVHAKGITA